MNADHLFQPSIMNLVMRKHSYLNHHAHEFVSLFAPHVSADPIRRGMNGAEIDRGRLSRDAPKFS